jgi:hypothetical protein
VNLYRRVRRTHSIEGISIREAARMFNLHRINVRARWHILQGTPSVTSVNRGWSSVELNRKPTTWPWISLTAMRAT